MDNYNKADTFVLTDSIKPDPNQPRKRFSKDHIEGLAISLSQEGMINPIEIDDYMTIITGECRWRASQLLNWKKVPVRINPNNYSEYERLRHQMAENVHQSGSTYDTMMNPMDTAEGYLKLLKLKGHDFSPGEKSQGVDKGITELSKEIGIAITTIWEHLKLLEEPEFVQKAIGEGLPRTYIREAETAPVEVQEALKKKIVAGDYKSREELIQDIQLLRKLPDLAQVALERQKAKESVGTNRILNGVARLGLALEAQSLEQVDIREKTIVISQLNWLMGKIKEYLL